MKDETLKVQLNFEVTKKSSKSLNFGMWGKPVSEGRRAKRQIPVVV